MPSPGLCASVDEGRRLRAVVLAGHADKLDVLHTLHVADEVLDLLGRDVLAAADDDILDASRDVVVAVGIHVPDVAGVQPAVGVDALGGLLGQLVVDLHRDEAAAADLAGLL